MEQAAASTTRVWGRGSKGRERGTQHQSRRKEGLGPLQAFHTIRGMPMVTRADLYRQSTPKRSKGRMTMIGGGEECGNGEGISRNWWTLMRSTCESMRSPSAEKMAQGFTVRFSNLSKCRDRQSETCGQLNMIRWGGVRRKAGGRSSEGRGLKVSGIGARSERCFQV